MSRSILSAGSEELRKVKDMLAEVQGLRASVEEVRAQKVKADRTLQTEERAVADSINTTVKKRRAELENGFQKEIQKEQNALKKVRSARDKAKSRGVAGRISEETAELRERNRMLHAAIRSMFKQKGLPRFCDSKLYYALYMPARISDILICAAVLALFFAVIPGVGSFFVEELWQKCLVFAVVWLVAGGIYLLLYRLTKGKNRAVLVDMKDSRKEIRKNEKEIRRIRKAIHADKSEDLYGLESFDQKIHSHEETIGQLTDRKNIVMLDFETNTRKVIADEITAQNAERIGALRDQCAELSERLATLTRREKELSGELAADYQAYLGLEYMDMARLQALIDLIDSGKAKTVQEAMDVWERQEREKMSGSAYDADDAEKAETGEASQEDREPSDSEIPEFEDEEDRTEEKPEAVGQ